MVHGRLSNSNGTPAVRLWKAGTHRLLGVIDPDAQDEYGNLPVKIKKLLEEDWQTEVWGDYVACPFTREQPKEMQMICIDSAKNLVSRKRQ
jgi:hypothetical protein